MKRPTGEVLPRAETRRHAEMREAVARDLARRARREPGAGTFWRSLRVIGVVGWSISLAAAGGALLGSRLDARLGTGVRTTLLLLVLGAGLGSWVAWKTLGETR